MTQLTTADFQSYNPSDASSVVAGPLALYSVAVGSIAPTQMNEGFAEVDSKAAAFDLLTTPAELQADLLGDVEPVVIGPNGQLYLLDGHHTFTALIDSVWGASNPTVYVNVIANYSNLTESEFFQTMQQNNYLLPLNNGVPETVNDATGAPIPTSLTGLTSDVYRGLEYSILKQKDSKLFTTTNNITGAKGASTPGLDKMPGLYSDFLEAAAYQDADGGLGLPYLSPGDIALATQWNLNPDSTTTLPNVSGTVFAYQLPGFILSQNVVISASISNSTLGQTVSNGAVVPGSMEGAIDGNGTFTGITEINAGTAANPIYIDTPNIGLILQVGADKGFTVTLSNADNTYIGGTTFLAGTLVIAGDGSLGAAPTESIAAFYNSLTFDGQGIPDNVTAAVQADNGIIFNSLSEGNGTLTIGTAAGAFTSSSPFTTSRPIAVGNEAATINVNGSYVELQGPLITLGYDNLGIGETTGFPDLTIDDLSTGGGSTPTAGTVVLSTPSPYFYGDIIIGNTGTPTVVVDSDAALGNTTGSADEIGQVELNGGTLQTGESFSAPERNIVLDGGSQIDLAGNTTTWGSLTDVKRTIAIGNSSSTAGAITFNNFTISQTSTLQLDGSANGVTYSGSETVTFTNGILQTAPTDTLLINPTALGTTEKLFSGGASTNLIDGMAPAWIITNSGGGASTNPYNFVTYGANGYVALTYSDSGTNQTGGIRTATSTSTVDQTGNATLSASAAAYALKINDGVVITATGQTITLGDGTDPAGLILDGGGGNAGISGGTLAFGGSEAVIFQVGSDTVSATITGSNGLVLAGSGTLTLSAASPGLSGPITIDSGELSLTAANVFSTDVGGLMLDDVKSKPSNSILNFTANQTFTTLNSVGTDSAITFSGATLTIGDTINNFSSTLSSSITETGSVTAGALTLDGSGLFDLSGISSGKLSLVMGSTIVVNNAAQLRVTASEFANANFGIDLNGAGTQLQFEEGGGDGQFANAVTGTGELHLIGGTLQLTGINNTYSGGTVVETGSSLDTTTANLSTVNENITDAGGLIVFDQDFGGTFTGVISDGRELGTGPMMSGSLDIDDSANTNASNANVTLSQDQAYSGATYVEAGTLTLGAANTIADSSGLTLGRVGGAVDGQTANLVLDANNQLNSLNSDPSNTTSVVLNGHTLTLDPTVGTPSSFGGTISDGSAPGSVVVDGTGTVTLGGNNSFSGGITVDSGTLELAAAGAQGAGTITLVGDPALVIDAAALPAGGTLANPIVGFGAGDTIDLVGLPYVSGDTTATIIDTNGTLQVTDGTYTDTLTLTGVPEGEQFTTADDGTSSQGTLIEEAPCYCRGTLILTPRGEVPVEALRIGDRVVTVSGKAQPIKWIGRRSYDGRFIAGNRKVLPIVISAGALAEGVPARDLWVSPEHALYIGRMLMPARLLVNGLTIVQAQAVERLEYFHIELDRHDVIFAEGAPAESYAECGNRLAFHNAGEYRRIYPDRRPAIEPLYAPWLEEGDTTLVAIRERLLVRAAALGHRLTGDPGLHLIVDGVAVHPLAIDEGVYRFALERLPKAVWLASRSAVPAETDPASADRRRLGVSLRRITLRDPRFAFELLPGNPHLQDGFHGNEGEHRWTDGLARLPGRVLALFAGPLGIDVMLSPSDLRYPQAPVEEIITPLELAPELLVQPLAMRAS